MGTRKFLGLLSVAMLASGALGLGGCVIAPEQPIYRTQVQQAVPLAQSVPGYAVAPSYPNNPPVYVEAAPSYPVPQAAYNGNPYYDPGYSYAPPPVYYAPRSFYAPQIIVPAPIYVVPRQAIVPTRPTYIAPAPAILPPRLVAPAHPAISAPLHPHTSPAVPATYHRSLPSSTGHHSFHGIGQTSSHGSNASHPQSAGRFSSGRRR